MSTFSERLKLLRSEKGWSQQRLADELGVSKSSVNMYERGEREPSFETTEAIADSFNVDMDFLYGRSPVRLKNPIIRPSIPDGFEPMPEMSTVPLVGQIACGNPITAEENIEDTVSVPATWHADFTLRCVGNSMEPRIQDGDLVAIHSQPLVENGEIAAVRIDCEATLKRVYLYSDRMVLQPENQAYAPIVLVGDEMNTVQIEGKAVGLCRGL